MVLIGVLLGFVGAGGSGFIISVLVIFFDISVYVAVGTSLSAMVFSSLSGAYSHYRENNVVVRVGCVVGVFGALGSFSGTRISNLIPSQELKWLTACILFLSALIIAIRIFTEFGGLLKHSNSKTNSFKSVYFWISACGVGITTGILSGVFGIGAASFIQIGLLVFFGLSIQESTGTTLFVILPIALIGGFGYYIIGNFNLNLLINVASGTIIGSYIGAKFTNRLPSIILKIALVTVPTSAALLLLFGK